MLALQNFQQRLFANYKKSVSLPADYNYFYGNPVQPVVPLETGPRAIFLLGQYPEARLAVIGPETDVPVANSGWPYSPDSYFDGRRVRTLAGGIDLRNSYLTPLGLRREQCWLTYLVRVYLFQDEDLARYRRLGCRWPARETRSQFATLARQGLDWLAEELALAQPRLVITLGLDVARVLQAVPGGLAEEALLGGQLRDLWLGERVYPAIHLADPALLLKQSSSGGTWLRRHWEEYLWEAREIVQRLVG